MTDGMSTTLVVVPAFNEEASVGVVVASVRSHAWDVLVVDDGSTDQTSRVAAVAGAHVLSLPINLGVGGALQAGFRFAVDRGYERVVQVDADGQHPVEQIGDLVQTQVAAGHDMVIGSRFLVSTRSMTIGRMRRIAMAILAIFASRATATKITDATSGFRVIAGDLLLEFSRNFPNYYLGDTYEALIVAGRHGFQVTEIPADIGERISGVSSASFVQSSKFLVKSVLIACLRIHIRIREKAQS